MEQTEYKERIESCIHTIHNAGRDIYSDAINLMMKHELEHIDNLFDDGDEYNFTFNQVSNSKDVNVQLLCKLVEDMETAITSLANINGIKLGEDED